MLPQVFIYGFIGYEFFFIAKFWTQLRLMDVKMSAAIKLPWIPVGRKGLRRTYDSGRNFGHLCCEIARHSTQLIIFNNAYDNKVKKKKGNEEKKKWTNVNDMVYKNVNWLVFIFYFSLQIVWHSSAACIQVSYWTYGTAIVVLRISGLHSISWSGQSTLLPGRLHDSANRQGWSEQTGHQP